MRKKQDARVGRSRVDMEQKVAVLLAMDPVALSSQNEHDLSERLL